MSMTAEHLIEANAVIRELDQHIANMRFGANRGGIVPPSAISTLREDLRDALATLDEMADERPLTLQARVI